MARREISQRQYVFRIIATLVLFGVVTVMRDTTLSAVIILIVGVPALWWQRIHWLPSVAALSGAVIALMAYMLPQFIQNQWLWRGLSLVLLMAIVTALTLLDEYNEA